MSEIPGDYKVGDWVRVVKGAWTAKGESKFSEPLEVRKVYKYAVLLSDGNVWNRGKVIKVPVWCSQEKLLNMGNKSGNNVDEDTSTSEPPMKKSEHEGVKVKVFVFYMMLLLLYFEGKGVCSILKILFRAPCDGDSSVLVCGTESDGEREAKRGRGSGGCGVSLPVMF
ncbi:hypothetical protein NDU88_004190 [Pleurodeles waltl]|uniref:Uncharacterized protein n=1 Tax=Pleurodeles waltl TaxID=8319 RepID=A0AAV7L7Y7_PLEWA|nr:hypothetical protein NDU88_004190 [Pleurodeles waltl]